MLLGAENSPNATFVIFPFHVPLVLPYSKFLAALPEPVNITERGGMQDPGFLDLHGGRYRVIRIHRSLICTCCGFTMGGELEVSYLIGELLSLWMEKQLNPSTVVLCGIRMGDFLAQRYRDIENLVRGNPVRAVNDGNMLLRLPIRGLIQISNGFHSHTSLLDC